ncbi:hypothetical protein HN51_031846, partial [Arachis hypogaea]
PSTTRCPTRVDTNRKPSSVTCPLQVIGRGRRVAPGTRHTRRTDIGHPRRAPHQAWPSVGPTPVIDLGPGG